MSLRMIIGRAGSGKSRCCIDEIRSRLAQESMGSPLIYIVPEQMSFQAEYALATSPGLQGMIRALVLSFRRLAWKVLQETGGMSRIHIDHSGIKMALRKIIEQHKHDFKLFGRAANQGGFLDQLASVYMEFKRYGVTPDGLLEKQKEISVDQKDHGTLFLRDKLQDLQLIFRELEKFLVDRYMDNEDYLPLLASKIPYSSFLEGAEIWVDGFHSFTPQEYGVLAALLRRGCRVNITLTLDEIPTDDTFASNSLFYPTGKTALKLLELADLHGIEVEPVYSLPQEGSCMPRFRQAPALAHLEKEFGKRPARPYEGVPEGLTLFSAANKRTEVDVVARTMIGLVRDHGYRWRDIAVFVRNPEDYKDLFMTVFTDYEIPFFLDQKHPMLHHPLLEFIRSAIEVVRFNWPYDALFRCIKTDLLLAYGKEDLSKYREQVDLLENYVLAHGIEGYRWTDGNPWIYRKYKGLADDEQFVVNEQSEEEIEKEKTINELREQVVTPLLSFKRRLEKGKTALDFAKGLYEFLEEIHVPEQLEQWSVQAREAGEPEKAREHGQAWQAIIDMLDQLVEIMGNESMDLDKFFQIIDSGLEGLHFSLVPPSLDQVLIGTMDRSRPTELRCAFILGINDGIIPARPKEDGLLAESEREFFSSMGLELAPGSRRQLLEEEFLLYSTMTSPREKLYLSYPLADEEGKALLPSILIKQIRTMFPSLEEQWQTMEPSDVEEGKQIEYVSMPDATLTYLATSLQHWRKGYSISSIWWDVYNKLLDLIPEKVALIRKGLFYCNQEQPLGQELSRKLYGKKLLASVSRMEKYRSCPFSQFLTYGLRLKEREIFRLETPDIGQLFHGALKLFGAHLQEHQLTWEDVTPEQSRKIAIEKVDLLAPRLQREILLSNNRYKYITKKLKNVVGRAAAIITEHGKRSEFVPLALELGFGPGEDLPPLRFTLPNGCEMELVGRIDRVDGARSEKGLYLRIIDYKSSDKQLKLADVYYGLSLQLLVYLDVLVTFAEKKFGEKALPAGVLYFHVHNPLLKKNVPPSLEELQKELFKMFKMKGLVLADLDVIRLMDSELDNGHSQMIPVSITKTGQFYKNASVATEEQFASLQSYLRELVQETGVKITEGDVSISPYRLRKQIPCTYCPYKGVCQFDQFIEGNTYRFLKNEPKDKIWEILQKRQGGNEDGNEEARG